MKTVYTPVASITREEIINPIYMTRQQREQAVYIPVELLDRIIIVDFIKEAEDEVI